MVDYFIGSDEGPRGTVNRAMVSLGPLSPKRYCTYKCAFCYVGGEFQRYPARSAADVLRWLELNRDRYDITYVSGDTDSFARPRTDEGIALLRGIASLDVDVLFTTRYAFTSEQADRIGAIASRQRENRKLFIGCASVLSPSDIDSEPKPIPSPRKRLDSLRLLAERGVTAVLAVRPLLPSTTASEMEALVAACPSGVRNVITGWYFANGQDVDSSDSGEGRDVQMYFDIARNSAREVRNHYAYAALERACRSAGLSLYLGSTGLIESLREEAL